MKSKLWALLCMVISVLSFAACSVSTPQATPMPEPVSEQTAEAFASPTASPDNRTSDPADAMVADATLDTEDATISFDFVTLKYQGLDTNPQIRDTAYICEDPETIQDVWDALYVKDWLPGEKDEQTNVVINLCFEDSDKVQMKFTLTPNHIAQFESAYYRIPQSTYRQVAALLSAYTEETFNIYTKYDIAQYFDTDALRLSITGLSEFIDLTGDQAQKIYSTFELEKWHDVDTESAYAKEKENILNYEPETVYALVYYPHFELSLCPERNHINISFDGVPKNYIVEEDEVKNIIQMLNRLKPKK